VIHAIELSYRSTAGLAGKEIGDQTGVKIRTARQLAASAR